MDTIIRMIGHMEGESRQVLVFEDHVLDVYSTLPRGVSEGSVLYLVSLSDIKRIHLFGDTTFRGLLYLVSISRSSLLQATFSM